jgi:hypothetical protein
MIFLYRSQPHSNIVLHQRQPSSQKHNHSNRRYEIHPGHMHSPSVSLGIAEEALSVLEDNQTSCPVVDMPSCCAVSLRYLGRVSQRT